MASGDRVNARQPGRLPVLLFTLAALLLSPQLDASRALASAAANASAPSYLETRIGASEIEGRDLVGALGTLSAEERSGYAASSGGSAAGEHLAVLVHNGAFSKARLRRLTRWGRKGLQKLSRLRGEIGPIPASRGPDEGVLAFLQVGKRRFIGMNAHGQPVVLKAKSFWGSRSFRHAEGDVFNQALRTGTKSKYARLFVDEELCTLCRRIDAVQDFARQIGVETLDVVTGSGIRRLRMK
ncbi:MAG TPA: hypothetical protein PLL76_23565 [Thermoanaerobaculia bacterium]|nr:hypothetical protein [Thermoanaerobaculia bacterium]